MNVKSNNVKHFDKLKNPGDFIFTYKENKIVGMIQKCPCGCGELGAISLNTHPDQNIPKWAWDGNEENPTLTPSIQKTTGCKWHGYLTKGIFTSV